MLVTNQNTIWDLALQGYGTLEQVVRLVNDNSSLLPNINANTTGLPGQELGIDAQYVVPIKNAQPVTNPVNASNTYSFISRQQQNLFDIALNTYGTIESLVQLLIDNEVTEITAGSLIKSFSFDSTLIKDINIYTNTTAKGYFFSTGTYEANGDFNNDFSDDTNNQGS